MSASVTTQDPQTVRLAWTGPVGPPGGVPGMGTLLLGELLEAGLEVDLYYPGDPVQLPALLRDRPGLRVIARPSRWRWGRWYSATPMTAFATGTASRTWAHALLGLRLLRNHRRQPYDLIYQFSQTELLALGLLRRWLPPIAVHPETHARGELTWHRRESAYARRSEGLRLHLVARAWLTVRSLLQCREARRADLVIAPSRVFAAHLLDDYELEPARIQVVPNVVDCKSLRLAGPRSFDGPVRLLYVSRISVRKGVEFVVELSHRLADLAGQVRIEVVGGRTQWSDYRRHLASLHPGTAVYHGPLPPQRLQTLYQQAHGLLLPSRYEPFGFVVAEALASGLPVVVSDQVGASEGVNVRCCRVFPDGDLDAFEHAVRRLIRDLRIGGADLGELARSEAVRCFSAEAVVPQFVEALTSVRSAAGQAATAAAGREGAEQ